MSLFRNIRQGNYLERHLGITYNGGQVNKSDPNRVGHCIELKPKDIVIYKNTTFKFILEEKIVPKAATILVSVNPAWQLRGRITCLQILENGDDPTIYIQSNNKQLKISKDADWLVRYYILK